MSPSGKQPLPGNAYLMRSDAVSMNTVLLQHVVNELTQAASWVHHKLKASTAAYICIDVHVLIVEAYGCSATQWINKHRANSCAVDVDAVTEESFFEH